LKARFLKAAQRELDEAIEYYEAQVPGLGAELLKEVRAAMERIEQYSEAWYPVSKRARRYQIKRFPYGVFIKSARMRY
jgi:toxin ParE2